MPWPIPIPAPVTRAFFLERPITGRPRAGPLAPLPALGEEIEVDVLLGVGFDDLFVQLDAEAWSLRELEIAVCYFGEARGALAEPADVAYVWLDHICRLKLEELPVLQPLVDALTRGDGRLYTVRSLLQCL